MKGKLVLLTFLTLFAYPCFSQTNKNQKITVDVCIWSALKNNPGLKAKQKETDISDKMIAVQKGKTLPTISFSSEYIITDQYNETNDYQSADASLQIYYPVWQNGKIRNEIRQAKAGSEATLANYKIEQSNMAFRVIESYITYLQLEKLQNLSENMVQRLSLTVDAANERLKLGVSKRSDVLKAQTEYSNLQYLAIQIKTSKNKALQSLLETSGFPLDSIVTITDSLIDYHDVLESIRIDSLNAIANQYLPEFEIVEKKIEQQGFSELIERKKIYPEIGAFGSYNYLKTPVYNENFYGNVGLSLKMDLFTGWRKKNQRAIERIKSEQLKDEKEETIRYVYSEIQTSFLSLSEARERINNAKIQTESSGESLQSINQQYLNGISSMLELIDAQYSDFRANQNYINALADYYQAVALLKRKTGLLTFEYCK